MPNHNAIEDRRRDCPAFDGVLCQYCPAGSPQTGSLGRVIRTKQWRNMLSLMFELKSIPTTSFKAMKMKAPTGFQFILSICIIMIGAIYLINPYQLVYSATKWQDFGKMPITPQQILDFTPQTSVWIGYIEPETKSLFTCREAIAYLETKDQKTYRCCNSPERTSCIPGDNLVQTSQTIEEIECQQTLMATFKIPSQLPRARDYKVFGYCPDSGDPRVTVVQITGNRAVLWKSINTLNLDIISSVLKCFIGPLLMVLAGWIIRRVSKTNFQT